MPRTKPLTAAQKARQEREAEANAMNTAGMNFLVAIEAALKEPGSRITTAQIADAAGLSETTMRSRIENPMAFKLQDLWQLRKAGLPWEAIKAVCGYPVDDSDEISDLLKVAIKKIIMEAAS